MDLLNKEIEAYAEQHTTAPSALLQRVARETHLHVVQPRMLSGYLQGRLLAMLAHMIKPKRALEIGTYTGYSALCLAEGLAEDGTLITIDINEELEALVRGYFEASAYSRQLDYKIGDAMEWLPKLEGSFDLVFIDADKVNYKNYYDLTVDRLNTGGFMIVDNVLWSGKVMEQKETQDADTRAIADLNAYVQQDDRVENILLPIRDGLMVLRRT